MKQFLTSAPIDTAALVSTVSVERVGGVCTFSGVVRATHAGREVVALAYSAYEEMAAAELRRVLAEGEARFSVRAAAQHRLGELAIGDIAVFVAVGAEHRDAAFEACRWIIDTIKTIVPIWKRETYADGSVAWVDPTTAGGISTASPATPAGPASTDSP